jgi:hypothetical protein
VSFSSGYSSSEKEGLVQSIKEVGQSPVGGRLMNRYIVSGSTLELAPESESVPGAGPHNITGTNRVYFSGNLQGSPMGAVIAKEPWGPSMNDATTFVHELSHTYTGYNVGDPLNTAVSENLYRSWTGAPNRDDYAVLSIGMKPDPVPNRSWLNPFSY